MIRTDSATGPGGPGRRRPGELEAQVINILSASSDLMSPNEVRDALGPAAGLSYSTVVTVLTRLFEKNLVARYRQGRSFRYGAFSDSAGLVADRMNRMLTSQPDRASVLRRFISTLAPDDERILRGLLNEESAD
ncbi:BlaI/MecI/CopY family transcriptional regulator [Actinoplanes sp. L3-i22]|uniref:BlaI/MecI/CopY family transcriptional regulator n=1 Tax=Actinoplanes sp. L3-i22 TaxID=2836373 RepID=UPI001C754EF2|nr:BlaI/MecI/CopY family transcriptional regulator [Actinoplanes sp. L3-i22]BCY11527.1 hypothetical protein L3i22_066150 [Actinoplanes sp. L3-i22]